MPVCRSKCRRAFVLFRNWSLQMGGEWFKASPHNCSHASLLPIISSYLPKMLDIVLASSASFASPQARKLFHSAARPLPTEIASLDFGEGPCGPPLPLHALRLQQAALRLSGGALARIRKSAEDSSRCLSCRIAPLTIALQGRFGPHAALKRCLRAARLRRDRVRIILYLCASARVDSSTMPCGHGPPSTASRRCALQGRFGRLRLPQRRPAGGEAVSHAVKRFPPKLPTLLKFRQGAP